MEGAPGAELEGPSTVVEQEVPGRERRRPPVLLDDRRAAVDEEEVELLGVAAPPDVAVPAPERVLGPGDASDPGVADLAEPDPPLHLLARRDDQERHEAVAHALVPVLQSLAGGNDPGVDLHADQWTTGRAGRGAAA
nr:hypothetical protein [Pseudonocardia sp. HH130629-09]